MLNIGISGARIEVMNNVKKSVFLWVIALLLIISSYMTTAFFIGTWPFEKQVETNITDETIEFLDGLGEENYKISNGGRLIFEDFSIVYPEGWIMMDVGVEGSVVGVDSLDPNTSVSVSKIDFGESNIDDIAYLLGERIDTWYKTAESKDVLFLEKNCTLFSGIIEKIDKSEGMLVLAVPSGDVYFLLTGVFEMEKKSQEKIESIFETFRLSDS